MEKKTGKKENILTKFFSRSKKNKDTDKSPSDIEKIVNWKMPGSFKEGLIFDPLYIQHAISTTQTIFNEYFERKDISSQHLCFSKAYSQIEDFADKEKLQLEEVTIADTLIKNQQDYKNYLGALDKDFAKQVQRKWMEVHREKSYRLGEYDTFKEIFNYRKNAKESYKALKNNIKVVKCSKLKTSYLTIEGAEKDSDVLAIVFFIKGNGHHYFFDFLKLDKSIDDLIIYQFAIMSFYEAADSERLHILFNSKEIDFNLFGQMGFTSRQQVQLSIKKPL